eukprot:4111108-Amphidinium_carterae.1
MLMVLLQTTIIDVRHDHAENAVAKQLRAVDTTSDHMRKILGPLGGIRWGHPSLNEGHAHSRHCLASIYCPAATLDCHA